MLVELFLCTLNHKINGENAIKNQVVSANFKKSSLALALGCLCATPAVLAQPGALEEVIVTASKLGEASLGETSFTVNVVGGQDLAARVITNPEDLRTAVSGVYIDEGSSTPRIAIRGVGFDNFQIQAENGVT
ncbi:MAG: hypothetical protein OXI50_10630, partial [Gammaproteobacteria bacterium]|nr:hypothetical protein [Gammaproteobacteria bacterium]